MTIVLIPPIAPRNLPEITAQGTTLDNGRDCEAGPARAMERAANHLLGGRKVCGAGSCSPVKVFETSKTWNYTVGREPFEGQLRVLVYVSTFLEGAGPPVGTITVSSTLGGPEVKDIVATGTELADDAIEYEIVITWGAGVAADMGTDDVEIVVAMSAEGCIVYGIAFEALGFAPPYGVGFVTV